MSIEKKEKYPNVGSLIQLAAKGPQDDVIYDSKNVKDSPFYHQWKQYTRFDKNQYSINKHCKYEEKTRIEIEKKGDLVGNFLLEIKLPDISGGMYINRCGLRLFKEAKLLIDGQIIQKFTNLDLQMYSKTKVNKSHIYGFFEMQGYKPALTNEGGIYYIYLPFLEGQYLPLISNSLSKIYIEIILYDYQQIITPSNVVLNLNALENYVKVDIKSSVPTPEYIETAIIADYIILDYLEKFKFMSNTLKYIYKEYNVEEVEYEQNEVELKYSKPVSEIIFYFKETIETVITGNVNKIVITFSHKVYNLNVTGTLKIKGTETYDRTININELLNDTDKLEISTHYSISDTIPIYIYTTLQSNYTANSNNPTIGTINIELNIGSIYINIESYKLTHNISGVTNEYIKIVSDLNEYKNIDINPKVKDYSITMDNIRSYTYEGGKSELINPYYYGNIIPYINSEKIYYINYCIDNNSLQPNGDLNFGKFKKRTLNLNTEYAEKRTLVIHYIGNNAIEVSNRQSRLMIV